MKLNLDLDDLSQLIINYADSEKKFRISPVLKIEYNLKKFLRFFFDYYGPEKKITLKNAGKYLSFVSAPGSKIHLWLQSISYGLRVSMIAESELSAVETANIIVEFYKTNIPNSPIILRSALDKYKFIVINNWTSAQLEYCVIKEYEHFKDTGEFPSFVSDQFEKYSVKNEILTNLKELIKVSETLDDKGDFDLSEKILKNTENLANKIGLEKIQH